MNTRAWIVAALIIGVILYLKYGNQEESAPPAAAPTPVARARENPLTKAKPTPPVAAAKAAAPVLRAPVAEQPPAQADGRVIPPKGSIPFELHDGLVVAYGDVLLGRPNAENFPDKGFIEAPKLFPWKTKEIAYSVHPNLPSPERVQQAIDYFNANTPVRFVPLANQEDSIVFSRTDIPLCLSYVGKIGGHQPVFLDDRCQVQEIIHEIMHALGFIHEHSRPDRDQYVRVNWNRIEEDKRSQFELIAETMKGPHIGRPFDYQSVMIYEGTAFAKTRGETTLESLGAAPIEPAPAGISQEDLNRLIQLFPQ